MQEKVAVRASLSKAAAEHSCYNGICIDSVFICMTRPRYEETKESDRAKQ